ncbi:hypothetical protein H6P81_009417 [Aristolochia fimbriata]|uniref:Uncharacterized protein n=1 Tax=Aristolochia fimbriata TaxID=158543 RepID=A0AAV7EKT2_ARIFI|nr:hypothetical protein H6P81_009417 [Aristolochia fimbriata]
MLKDISRQLLGCLGDGDPMIQACAPSLLSRLVFILLDCIRDLHEAPDPPGTKLDIDRVFCLIPKWVESVQNWTSLIAPLIEKMFAEPSNGIIVRFLSHISENLAEARDVVLQRVLVNMQMHDLMDVKCLANCLDEASTTVDSTKLKGSLFDRLCPLLILRLLPLGVFSELNSSLILAYFLFAPHLWFGVKIASHPAMARIKQVLEKVLLWPSVDSNEGFALSYFSLLPFTPYLCKFGSYHDLHLYYAPSKAQHGCIDYFALMICTGLQISLPSTGSTHISDAVGKHSVLCYVIQRLPHNQSGSGTHGSGKNTVHMDSRPTIGAPDTTEGLAGKVVPIPFRLCMANVLISVCQKISSSSKNSFARAALPVLIPSIKMIAESEVRAACLQVLFSAVYHLMSAVRSCSNFL